MPCQIQIIDEDIRNRILGNREQKREDKENKNDWRREHQ